MMRNYLLRIKFLRKINILRMSFKKSKYAAIDIFEKEIFFNL